VKKLVITADDFGLNRSVNQAIEKAHREGILTAASLMMGEEAVSDAVKHARAIPHLRVGLHLSFVDGRAVLPPYEIPNIVDSDGCFSPHIIRTSFRIALCPRVRRDLEREIRAQFEAFHATGLSLDHVDVHHHLHLHPVILKMVLRIGASQGLQAMRLVHEPFLFSWGVRGRGLLTRMIGGGVFLRPLVGWMRRQLKRGSISHNDRIFGIYDTGRISESVLLRLLDHLSDGITEVHLHPRHCEDLECHALLSEKVREQIREKGIICGGYGQGRSEVGGGTPLSA